MIGAGNPFNRMNMSSAGFIPDEIRRAMAAPGGQGGMLSGGPGMSGGFMGASMGGDSPNSAPMGRGGIGSMMGGMSPMMGMGGGFMSPMMGMGGMGHMMGGPMPRGGGMGHMMGNAGFIPPEVQAAMNSGGDQPGRISRGPAMGGSMGDQRGGMGQGQGPMPMPRGGGMGQGQGPMPMPRGGGMGHMMGQGGYGGFGGLLGMQGFGGLPSISGWYGNQFGSGNPYIQTPQTPAPAPTPPPNPAPTQPTAPSPVNQNTIQNTPNNPYMTQGYSTNMGAGNPWLNGGFWHNTGHHIYGGPQVIR